MDLISRDIQQREKIQPEVMVIVRICKVLERLRKCKNWYE